MENFGTELTEPEAHASIREQTLEEKVDEMLAILRPLQPLIEQAPEALAQVGPFLEKIQNNPLLRGLLR
jgi:hypothetical protein